MEVRDGEAAWMADPVRAACTLPTSFPTESPAMRAKARPIILAHINRTERIGRDIKPERTVCRDETRHGGQGT